MSVKDVNINQLIVGLTGSIASGKTTVSDHFKKHQIPVIDSDLIVEKLWQDDSMKMQIAACFQMNPMDPDLKIKVAYLVFQDYEKLQKLNQILHPVVLEKIEEEKLQLPNAPLIIIDIPLLFEINYQNKVDLTVLVYARKEQLIKRLMKRNTFTKSEATIRVDSQLNIEEKKKIATIIFDNSQSKKFLIEQVNAFIEEYKHGKSNKL